MLECLKVIKLTLNRSSIDQINSTH